ncbi:tail fiber domain-containing protein [Streptomyces antarcticus]|uniref:tail fiber domain-containing protein n=1 Tax=Streptomyces antarcticus TaxID=2996458 RepID=UPI0022717B38|nr:tail fiber domain-containing protein [Streptomyces sp. H34-AA3]MCY0946834.1 tail fiber domain-containing protein [Streptomyces sp. H34-AA3]
MAITSYPFDGQAVTETQFSQMFREFQDSGVVTSLGASGFSVSASTGMTLTVGSGLAFVRGHMVQSTATENVTIAAASTQVRVDRVVLKLDPATNSITLAVKAGTAGSTTPPALTQTDTGIYEMALASVTVAASVTSITSGDITATRPFVGHRVGAWITATRPTSPRLGQLGYNNSTDSWEYWTGSAWAPLLSTVDWSNLSGKPTTFTPSTHTHTWSQISDRPSTMTPTAHTHDWSQVTGKPTSFAPSAHGHAWSQLTGIPSTFAPSSHSHSWDSITSKPSTFAPSSHSHSGYLGSGDTIHRANGSDRPHSYTATGSTWYAVWVDGNHNFCRNTSARRYKENIRDIEIDPDAVLSLRPRVYDRKPTVNDEGETVEGRRDEFGLIAEEVDETLPEIVIRDEEGQIDSVRYDLIGVALLSVVQDQAERIERLEQLVRDMSR